MDIYDFNNYNSDSVPPSSFNAKLSDIEQTKGIVCHDDRIVCKAFPNVREYVGIPEDMTNEDINNFDWNISLEVTLLMIFNYNGKWYLRTTKNLDAFKSFWLEEKSFGQIFVETLDQLYGYSLELLYSQLEKERVYTFSLTFTGLNCMVMNNKERHIYYCGSFRSNGEDFTSQYVDTIPELEVLPLLNFGGISDMNSFIEHALVIGDKYPEYHYQGIIGVEKTKGCPRVIKIYNKQYKEEVDAINLRNKLLYEYLQIRGNENQLENFYQTYAQSSITDTTDEYERTIEEICKTIFEIYVSKFVKKEKNIPKLHPVCWRILRDIHAQYISEKKIHKEGSTRLERVEAYVDNLSANDLRRLIYSFMKNKLVLDEQ